MAVKYQLSVIAKGDVSDATKALRNLESRAGRTSGRVREHAMRMAKSAAAGSAIIATAAVGASAKMVSLASDATETQGKLEVTFGKSLPNLTKRLDTFAKSTGASRYALREQAATIGALLKPMKLGAGATADMSVNVTKLATDLSSFNNVPVDDALASLKSGLTGETEPLKKFGILMNEAAVQTEAVRLGLIKKGGTLTEQQKVQARYSIILGQTKDAQGDAERTAGSLANRMRALQNRTKDVATDLGMKLQPAALSMVNAGMRLITWMQQAVQKGGTLRPMIDGIRVGFGRAKDAVIAAGAAFVSGFAGPAGKSSTSARDVAAAIGQFAAKAGALAQQYLPPLAQKLGEITRFLFDHRGAVLKTVLAVALFDKGIKAVRLGLAAYGTTARAATKVVQLYRLAKWQLAATEAKSRIATVASTVATKAAAAASRAAAIGMRLLGVALRFATGPVGLAITAVSLLVAGFVLAYKRSDTFRNAVDKVVGAVKRVGAKILQFKEYLLLLAGPAGALVLAYRKSNTFRAMVGRVVDKLKEIGSTIKDVVLGAITSLRKAFGKLQDKLKPVADTLGKVGGALSGIGGLAGKAAGAIGGVGDGIGVGPKVGGVDSFTPIAARMGLTMTSALRPGDDGYHGLNRARDYSNGFGPTPQMMKFAALMGTLYGSSLKELIYTPMGWGIKNGQRVNLREFYGEKVAAAHNNHVHIAMQRGGLVPGSGTGDIVPARLEPGEFVVNRSAVAAMGAENLAELNAGRPRFGGPKPKAKKRKAPTLQQKFDSGTATYGARTSTLDLGLAQAEGTAGTGDDVAAITKLQKAAQERYNSLVAFMRKNGKKLKGQLRADVQASMADALRASQGFGGQIKDINQEAADAAQTASENASEAVRAAAEAAAEAAQAAADAAAEAAQRAYEAWRSQWSNRATMLDLALAQAEETADTADDAAVLAQLAANARDEYNNLLARMQDGSLDEATRLELASGAAAALRQATQINKQIEDMNAESLANSKRALSENERRGLSLLGISTAPGATEVTVQQYFSAEPNAFAASKGVQWALQGALG